METVLIRIAEGMPAAVLIFLIVWKIIMPMVQRVMEAHQVEMERAHAAREKDLDRFGREQMAAIRDANSAQIHAMNTVSDSIKKVSASLDQLSRDVKSRREGKQ